MPLITPRAKRSARPALRAAPSCRGGASSLLRLVPPATHLGQSLVLREAQAWGGRSGSLAGSPADVASIPHPIGFAPSRWLLGQ